jgi:hypothetical protein
MDNLKLIARGNTSEIFEYGPGKILKLYWPYMPRKSCEDEFFITQKINRELNIGPCAYELISYKDRIGGIYERVEGLTLTSHMLRDVLKIRSFSRQLAHYHIAIQQPCDLGIASVAIKLKEDIEAVDELSQTEKMKLYHYIDALPEGSCLCHFDFHPGNIIMQNGKPVVIDWMTACTGDKLADVARTGVLLKHSELATKPFPVRKIIKLFQRTIYKSYIKEYLELAQTDKTQIEQWEYPIMAARLRESILLSEKRHLLKMVRKFAEEL